MQDIIRQRLRTVNVAGAASIILLAAATVAFGIVPLFKSGTRDIQAAAQLNTRLRALEQLGQMLDKVEQDRQMSEGRLQQVEKRLPSTSETNAFISDLAKLTRTAGVRMDATNYPKELKDCGAYRALPVEVAGAGDWESCYKFLVSLRATERLTRLDSLVLEIDPSQPQGNERQLCHITAGLSTFFKDR